MFVLWQQASSHVLTAVLLEPQMEQLVPLTALADQYDIGLLVQLCQEAIAKGAVDQRCCCRLYLQARAQGMEALADLCWGSMLGDVSGMLALASEDYVQLEFSDVLRLCNRHGGSADGNSIGGSAGQGLSSQVDASAGAPTSGDASRCRLSLSSSGSMGGDGSGRAAGDAAGDMAAEALVLQPAPAAGTVPGSSVQAIQCKASEFVIFTAIVRWCEADPARMQHIEQLLGYIRFDLMAYMELAQLKGHHVFKECAALQRMLQQACQQHHEARGTDRSGLTNGMFYGWATTH